MLDKKLIKMLVCPVDKAELIEDEQHRCLVCSICGGVYPVKNGIPVMLVKKNNNAQGHSKS